MGDRMRGQSISQQRGEMTPTVYERAFLFVCDKVDVNSILSRGPQESTGMINTFHNNWLNSTRLLQFTGRNLGITRRRQLTLPCREILAVSQWSKHNITVPF